MTIESAPRPKSAKSRWVNALLTTMALALLAWTVWKNREKLAQVWARKPDPGLFALGLALYVVGLLVTFLRWHRLVTALGLPFRVRDAVRLGFIGNVFNLVIPGAVGGDVVKAGFLCREQERKTQAVASMVIDRLLGLLGLFVLAGAVGAIAWNGASPGVRRLVLLSWGLVACGTIGMAILFTPALYTPMGRLVRGRGKLEAIFAQLVEMAGAYRTRLDVVFQALMLAVLGHSIYALCFFLADRALFGAEAPSVLGHYLVVPLILLSTAIPLPFGALGVTEQVSGTMFRDVLQFEGGEIAMLGFRAIMYAAGLISVVVFVANERMVRDLRGATLPVESP